MALLVPGQPAALDVTIRKDGVEVADGAGGRTGVLTLKVNDYGLWQWVWPRGSYAYDYLFDAFASNEDLGRYGLVFRYPDDPTIIASGPITTMIAADGNVNGVATDAVSAWGVTDITHLRERIIFPVWTEDLPNSNVTGTTGTFSQFDDEESGSAENILLRYVRRNLGDLALTRRRLPWATLTVPAERGAGPSTFYRPKANTNVLAAAVDLASLAGTTFDVVQTGNNALSLIVRDRVERTGIIFDPSIGTALGVQLKRQRRPKTEVIASGSGDDASVVYVRRRAASPSPGITEPPGGYSEVREEFIKGSGDDADELIANADAELVEDGPELGIKVEPAPGVPWRVGRDYFPGDYAIGVFRGASFFAPIEEIVLRHQDGTLVEEPSVGFADDDNVGPVLDVILKKIARLEGRA